MLTSNKHSALAAVLNFYVSKSSAEADAIAAPDEQVLEPNRLVTADSAEPETRQSQAPAGS